MLVLTRKVDQTIEIGNDIRIMVVSVHGNRVRLGIEAPTDVRVVRTELKQESAAASPGVYSEQLVEYACPELEFAAGI